MSEVALVTLTEVPALEPNLTVVDPLTNPVPVTVTGVPPAKGHCSG